MFSVRKTRVENRAGRTVFIQGRERCTFPNCELHFRVQFRYRQRASPYAIHTFRPVCVLWLEKVVLLCFGYSLRERTNDYASFERFVKYLRLSRRNLCYFVLRKRGMIMERNTVCATVLFHRYYYNLLSGRFQPLGEVFNW